MNANFNRLTLTHTPKRKMVRKSAGIIAKDDVVSVATVHMHMIQICMSKTMLVMHLNQNPSQPLTFLHPMIESQGKQQVIINDPVLGIPLYQVKRS